MTDQGPDRQGDSADATPMPPPPQPTPPPPVVSPVPAGGVGAPADLGPRFLARLIDHILLGIVTVVIVLPIVVAAAFANAANGFGFYTSFSPGSLVSAIITAAITIGYFTLMEANVGQTIGKMLVGLKTAGPDGNKPTVEQALKRNAWYALGIVPFVGGLAELALIIYIAVTISNSVTRTGWHDTFAGGTQVIKTK